MPLSRIETDEPAKPSDSDDDEEERERSCWAQEFCDEGEGHFDLPPGIKKARDERARG